MDQGVPINFMVTSEFGNAQ